MSVTMGQILDTTTKERVPFDEEGDNGLILGDKYIPEELIAEIFFHVDHKSLLNSQLVCKRWKIMMESYVWRKKAEITIGRSLQPVKDMPWTAYYTICKKKPFGRNFLKNNCGQEGVEKYWTITNQGGDHWRVECPPVGVPSLPPDVPRFKGKQYCFVTSYNNCSKWQTIDLESEGLTSQLLDTMQPHIVAGEWYSSRWDCPATYEYAVSLLGEGNKVLKLFEFRRSIDGCMQNHWHYVSHEFSDYGPGVKKIRIYHSGVDNLFWAGHYGSKMAGGSVIVKVPDATHHLEGEKLIASGTK